MSNPAPAPGTFSAALKPLRVDDRGRVNIGTLIAAAKGSIYTGAVNATGQILLTPAPSSDRKE